MYKQLRRFFAFKTSKQKDKKQSGAEEVKFKSKSLAYDPNKPRNRPDYMKWMTDEETFRYLEERRNNYSVLLVNILYDNNAGNIIRSANAFGAKEIILYGHKRFDRRASVGAEYYTKFRHVKYVEDLDPVLEEFDQVVGIDNMPQSIPLSDFKWDKNKKTLIVFGQEGKGLPEEILQKCDALVEIVQMGSVRSLNVSVAAGIVMNDYCQKTSNY